MIRFPMIYFIVVIHAPRLVSYADNPTFSNFIGSFAIDGLARLGIPMLTCISGFLVFRKALDLNYPLLMRKRFISLVTPLLIWNIPVVLALYVAQSQGLVDYDFASRKTMYPFDLMTWLNAVFSITDYPIIGPMHFLRDLFVICLFAPWLGMLLRNIPILGLIVLLIVFMPNLDGHLIRTDTMIISFYVGGMAATMNWDLKVLDKFAIPLVFLLMLICTLVVLMDVNRPNWLRLLAPFIVWPASSMLLGTRLGRWLADRSRASIFLFLFHGLILLALFTKLPNLYNTEYALFFWLTIPVLVAVMSELTYSFLNRFFPTFLVVLMGGRKTTAQKEASVGA